MYDKSFYQNSHEKLLLEKLAIRMANGHFLYGLEYYGVYEEKKMVQTSLTEQCYLTLTQAIHSTMGRSLVGPAGTSKKMS